jgi:photosystem II stability/assembly factor-like uncharacterized protein
MQVKSLIAFFGTFFFFSAFYSQQFFKPSQTEIEQSPDWVKEMYAENPNVFRVDSLYQNYFANHTFVKSFHTQHYKRWRRTIADHINPNGFIRQYSQEELEAINLEYRAQQSLNKASNWSVFGPVHTTTGNGNQGSDQTNVYCIDQCESQPSVLYLGTEPGEVFKSVDGGANWTSSSLSDDFGGTNAIEVCPTNGNLVYVGGNKGIFKSTDGGTTWTNVMPENNLGVNEILMHPTTNQIVFAATEKGLFRTTNGGATWTQLYTQKCYDIKFNVANSNIVYLLKNNPSALKCEFFISTDQGASWTLQSNGWYNSTDPARYDGGARLAVTLADPSRIYAYLIGDSKTDDYGYIGVYKSIDGGYTWTLPNGPAGGPYNTTHLNLAYGNPGWTYHQGFYNCAIVASPSNPEQILVGGLNLYRSDDGGATFYPLAGYVGGPLNMHVDMQDFRQVNGNTWVTTDGGAYLSTDFFSSQPIFKMDGVRGSDFWGFGSGWNEDVLVGGLYHNGNLGYYQNYPNGHFRNLGGGEAPTGYVNTGENRRTYFSDIGGKILPLNINNPLTNAAFGLTPNESYYAAESSELEFHPNCYSIAYMGKENKLWKTTDGGASFNLVQTFGSAPNDLIMYIEISSVNPDVMYVCQRPASGTTGKLWKTIDGGFNWTQLNLPAGNSRRILISLNPENDNEFWIAYPSGANGFKTFHTNNSGLSWDNITTLELNNQSIHSLVYIAGTNGGLYAATNNAVYYRNSTSNWTLDNSGLPTFINGNILKPFYRDGKIRLASYGKGIWESPLNEVPSHPICRINVDKLSQTVFCEQDSFYFEDHSFLNHFNASWSWEFPTGSPSLSNQRNPSVLFSSPGQHLAVLSITDQFGNSDQDSIYVEVLNYSAPTLVQEGFEGAFLPNGWFTENEDGGGQWSLESSIGGFGNSMQCALFDNYGIDSQGSTDDLSFGLNTLNMSELNLSFDVAYAPWGGSYSDSLKVLISTDCGVSYNEVYFKGGTTLATAPAFTSLFVPASNEWRTENINLNSYVGHEKVIVTFRNKGHWGNALYIDNVNISNDLNTNTLSETGFGVYPNPIQAGETLYFDFSEKINKLELINTEGKICEQFFSLDQNQISIPTRLKTGIYTIRIESDSHMNYTKIFVK